ncbi:ubiquitin-conjugating enzyme E2-binding protein [Myxozyma melibiosi]|uniref:Ubiquitin-conjugating enzyme E2-binding protein n=1 Tax=Myxozyma melibiosi TaxID=54550 RepID=A0ABR1FES4_9ASCO
MAINSSNPAWNYENVIYYSELLPRVSKLSLVVSPLESEPSHLSRLGSSKLFVKLSASDSSSTIELPAKVSPDTPISLKQLAAFSEGSLSLRLTAARQERETHTVPFPANELSQARQLHCRSCDEPLLRNEVKFLNMPSENWYEMMDYWHCHKPDHDHNASNAISKDMLKPRQGVSLVGVSYIDVLDGDLVELSEKNHSPPLRCAACTKPIGVFDAVDKSIAKIHKWNISLTLDGEKKVHDSEIYFAEILLEIGDIHANYHFAVSRASAKDDVVFYLWVFNNDLTYSSSFQPHPQRAMKIFYSTSPPTTQVVTESIDIPDDLLEETMCVLNTRNRQLPESLRKFGEWDVSLFHRL